MRPRPIVAGGLGLLLLVASACGGETAVPSSTPGGYAQVAVGDRAVVTAAAFAVDAQRRAMRSGGDAATLELVRVLAAESQVVAGTNFRLTLRVRLNGAERTADTVVWWQAWRQPDPYRLTSWQWR